MKIVQIAIIVIAANDAKNVMNVESVVALRIVVNATIVICVAL